MFNPPPLLADLKPGQMVHSPELTLMDAMAAIQILDPRMDSGMHPIPENIIAPCDRLPSDAETAPFDVNAPISRHDLLWIMDRMTACEAAWLQSDSLSGASLAQTVHTCLYVHSLPSLHPSAPPEDQGGPSSLARNVLRPYLIGVLKTVGLIWDELSKGNLIDGEDFNGDKAGVSLLEDLDPNSALSLLQAAIDWVAGAGNGGDAQHDEVTDSIRERLLFRKHFLSSVLFIARLDPTLPSFVRSDDIGPTLEGLDLSVRAASDSLQRILSSSVVFPPDLSSAPSRIARAAFDPWHSRNDSTAANYAPLSLPPASPVQLEHPQQWRFTYDRTFEGLLDFKRIANPAQGWAQWKSFFDREALTFQAQPMPPYVRSLRQSAVCSDVTIALEKPLVYLAESFLCDLTAINIFDLALQASIDPRTASISKRVEYFMERLAGQLVCNLRNLAQNRSRSKRRLARSYGDLLALSDEASALGVDLAQALGDQHDFHPDTLQAVVQTVLLDVMLHCIFSGLELELYRDDELNLVYWMANNVADEAYGVWHSISSWLASRDTVNVTLQRARSYVNVQMCWLDVVRSASKAFSSLYVRPAADVSRLNWLLVNGDVDRAASRLSDEMAFTMFCKRFKWLVVMHRPESKRDLEQVWRSYCREAPVYAPSESKARSELAGVSLDRAAKMCKELAQDADSATLSFAPSLDSLATSFQRISAACSALSSDLPNSEVLQPTISLVLMTFLPHSAQNHSWFPLMRIA